MREAKTHSDGEHHIVGQGPIEKLPHQSFQIRSFGREHFRRPLHVRNPKLTSARIQGSSRWSVTDATETAPIRTRLKPPVEVPDIHALGEIVGLRVVETIAEEQILSVVESFRDLKTDAATAVAETGPLFLFEVETHEQRKIP